MTQAASPMTEATRKIDFAADDDQRHRQRDDAFLDRQLKQIDEVSDAQEIRGAEAVERDDRAQQREHHRFPALEPVERAHDRGALCSPETESASFATSFNSAPPHSALQALQDNGVARHRQQNEEPEHRVEPELADAEAEETLFERPDHHGAEHRARDRSGAAKDIDAADDDRGDHAELEAAAGFDGDVAETNEKHEAAEACERPADDEREEDDALHRQADELRRLGVGADRIEPPGKTQIGRAELEYDDDDEGEDEQGSDVEIADRRDVDQGRPVSHSGRLSVVTVLAPERSTSTPR